MPNTEEGIELLIDLLESTPWTEEIAQEVIEDLGIDRPQLNELRARALERIWEEDYGTREHRRVAFLLDLERDIRTARDNTAWTALSKFLHLKQQLLGLDIPPLEYINDDDEDLYSSDPVESAKAHLRSLVRMRNEAQGRGSMVAAEKLMASVGLALARVHGLEEERRQDEGVDLTDDEIVQEIHQAIEGLPPQLRKRVLGSVFGDTRPPKKRSKGLKP